MSDAIRLAHWQRIQFVFWSYQLDVGAMSPLGGGFQLYMLAASVLNKPSWVAHMGWSSGFETGLKADNISHCQFDISDVDSSAIVSVFIWFFTQTWWAVWIHGAGSGLQRARADGAGTEGAGTRSKCLSALPAVVSPIHLAVPSQRHRYDLASSYQFRGSVSSTGVRALPELFWSPPGPPSSNFQCRKMKFIAWLYLLQGLCMCGC